MKKIDLFRLEAGLQAVSAFTGVKWAYAVVKNLRIIGAQMELLHRFRDYCYIYRV